MKVQFVMNVPETLALQDPSGLYNVEYEEVSYPTVDGRILTLPVLAAERLNALFLRPGETFTVCRQWSKEKGTIPHFVFCLTAASEQARAAEESAHHAPLGDTTPPRSGKRLKRKKGLGEVVTLRPDQPHQLWDRGTGTYGPAPRPAIQTARPQRIPYNVAFREIVQFVITELKQSGEQWSDQARQDLVSTVLIGASRQNLLDVWERQ